MRTYVALWFLLLGTQAGNSLARSTNSGGSVANLTPMQRAEFQEAFSLFDKDGDGFITVNEYGRTLRELGKNLSTDKLLDLISDVDRDRNRKVDFEEFVNMMLLQIQEEQAQPEISQAFRVFDKDGNRLITLAELKHVMKTLGEELTDNEAVDMLREADIDGDGQLNFREFAKMMTAS